MLQNGGVIYVTRFNRPLASHTIEILELAGLDITKCVHIKEITKCNRLILPDNSLYLSNGYRFYTQEFKEIIQLIQMNVQKKMAHTCLPIYDKLYFTRTKLNDWRDHGEASIEKVFKKKGFQIIAPEQYSPTEQIYMLMHCAEFATMSGSPAHSAEFCMKGTTFIDIRKADYWNTYQEVVNDLADLNVVLVDAHKSCMVKSNAPWGGPFFVYLTPEIKRYSGVVRFALPLILRPSWLKYRYRNYLKECYYNIRAKLGIKTKLKKIYSRIRLVRFYS